jgi:hypothetical protein
MISNSNPYKSIQPSFSLIPINFPAKTMMSPSSAYSPHYSIMPTSYYSQNSFSHQNHPNFQGEQKIQILKLAKFKNTGNTGRGYLGRKEISLSFRGSKRMLTIGRRRKDNHIG